MISSEDYVQRSLEITGIGLVHASVFDGHERLLRGGALRDHVARSLDKFKNVGLLAALNA